MKHRLAALFLAAALFCTLLAGCAPTPDVPGPGGGSASSGSTNNGGNSESEDNNSANSPKLQPSIVMETYNIHSNVKNEHVVSCVFSATNPNTAYSVTRGRVGLTMKDSAGKVLETTYFMLQTIAPGDTVRFAYTYTCKNGRPSSVSYSQPSTTSSSFKDPTGAIKANELSAEITEVSSPDGLNYNRISGSVTNKSRYPSKRTQISIILKKNGKIVSSDFLPLTISIPSGGKSDFTLYHTKDVDFNPKETEVIATPWF